MRNYPRLSIEEFGTHLLESGDLDPVYIALRNAELPENQLHRWLIGYWCFYHCGVASYLSEFEGDEFWEKMMVTAVNDQPTAFGTRWPRGHERRHFRGEQGIKAVAELQQRYSNLPEAMVATIIGAARGSNGDYKAVANAVKTHRGYGDWISFKVCDMMDRVLGEKVDFSEAAVFMFKDPREAAFRLWRLKAGLPDTARPKDETEVIHQVVNYLKMFFKDFSAPPSHDRSIGLQEVETVLCKWKSHCNGHYPLNNDIQEINVGLQPWTGVSETAKIFLSSMPKEIS